MYRVELKVFILYSTKHWKEKVPNVPCGVERMMTYQTEEMTMEVPNVPCGVESNFLNSLIIKLVRFLMYRVELKEILTNFSHYLY